MKCICFSGLIFLTTSVLFSQNENEIETVEIKIVKDYNVFIEEAQKLNSPIVYNPQFKDKSAQKKLDYKLPDRIEQFKFEPSSIEPMAYKSSLNLYPQTNFFKLGIGSSLNPIIEWSHLDLKGKTPYNIHVFHHSAWKGVDSNMKYSETKGIVEVKKQLKNWLVSPSITVNHKLYNFYGNVQESLVQSPSSRNYFNGEIALTADMEKTELKTISFKNRAFGNIGLDNVDILNTKKANHEIHAGNLSQLSYLYSENAKINLGIGAQYYTFKYDTFVDKWLVNANPNVEYKTKALKVMGGLDFVQTLTNSKGVLYVFPKLESELQLIPNYVNFYSLWERKIELNTLRNHLSINPFIGFDAQIIPNTKVENRSAGIKGLIKGVSYHAYFTQKIMKDAILFRNDDFNPRYLTVVTEKNMTQNNVSLELGYKFQQIWSTYLKADLFLYELDNLPVAFNLPSQRLIFGNYFFPTKKFQVSVHSFLLGGVKTLIHNNIETTPLAFDLNIGGEFHFSKNFYIFANLNNILNSKIAPQFGYNSLGFNGQGGFRIVY